MNLSSCRLGTKPGSTPNPLAAKKPKSQIPIFGSWPFAYRGLVLGLMNPAFAVLGNSDSWGPIGLLIGLLSSRLAGSGIRGAGP